MTLYRCFAWDERATDDGPDGALWFPRVFQGEGRHDNPDLYGCLYLSDRPISCIVEQLARFRGQRLTPPMLRRRGLPLALADLHLDDRAAIVDLDDPAALSRHHLRPSLVATRDRDITQPQARALFTARRSLAGLRWWSVWESLWANITLFDRARHHLRLTMVRRLALDDPAVVDAAQTFGLRITA
jgi:hypothetical protein